MAKAERARKANKPKTFALVLGVGGARALAES